MQTASARHRHKVLRVLLTASPFHSLRDNRLCHITKRQRCSASLSTRPLAQMGGKQASSFEAADNRPSTSGRQLLSVAPMMDWTDIHYRQLARLVTKRTWLWTEMVVDKTIIHCSNIDKFLWYPEGQRPLVFQLGGSDPQTLAQAARKVAEFGYDEINLNCGCPSDRVAGAGCFGATLMLQPQLVASCMAAVGAAVQGTPVNVKCRLGVDEVDSYGQLCEFIKVVSQNSPVTHFIIHARKCFLRGLNPHQNRTVPPLRHDWVWALKNDFPHLQFSLNGGLMTCYEAKSALDLQHPSLPEGAGIEGVMIGRGAYNDPWGCLSDADRAVFGEAQNAAQSRRQVLKAYAQYGDAVIGRWETKPDGHRSPSVRAIFKPLLNIFHGAPSNKKWKNAVDTLLKNDPKTVSEVLDQSLHLIPDHILDAPPEQVPLDSLEQYPLATLEWPGPAMRAGIKQEPVGVAQLVAAVAEAAQAEEVQGSQDAGAGGGKAGSVSACALKAALEEERSVPVENEELEAVVEPELKKQAVGV